MGNKSVREDFIRPTMFTPPNDFTQVYFYTNGEFKIDAFEKKKKEFVEYLTINAMQCDYWNLSVICGKFPGGGDGTIFPGLDKVIEKHKKLKGLYLNNNLLDLLKISNLLPVFSQHPSLEELYIQSNYLGTLGLNALFKSLEKNRKLHTLVAYQNMVNETSSTDMISGFASLLSNNSTLTSIAIRLTASLDKANAAKISEALRQNYSLRSLDLFDTQSVRTHYTAPEPYLSIIHLRIKRNVGGMIATFFAFLMGFSAKIHKKENTSAIRTAYGKSEIFDRNTIYLIFDFLS